MAAFLEAVDFLRDLVIGILLETVNLTHPAEIPLPTGENRRNSIVYEIHLCRSFRLGIFYAGCLFYKPLRIPRRFCMG